MGQLITTVERVAGGLYLHAILQNLGNKPPRAAIYIV